MELTKETETMLRGIFTQRGQKEKQTKVERFRRLNRYVKQGQIVFAGSSLMEQFPIEEFQLDLNLPLNIYNRGIGGYTTPELLETMEPCIYDLQPAYVFINIGTNDLNSADYQVEQLISRYKSILQGIQKNLPDTKIFVLAYYPVNTQIGMQNPFMKDVFACRTNARIADANVAVEKLAAECGATYLDLNQGLCDETGSLKEEYTVEGMHLYADGYRVVLQNLLPVLQTLK